MKKRLSLKRTFLFITTSFLALLMILFSYSFLVIYTKVKITCVNAQKEYKENCVNSLTKLVQSDKKTFREKNTAIWALGQLADQHALPTLRSFYTGNIPSKESLDKTISQYELKKAIQWCEKGNITSWMYKNFKEE